MYKFTIGVAKTKFQAFDFVPDVCKSVAPPWDDGSFARDGAKHRAASESEENL